MNTRTGTSTPARPADPGEETSEAIENASWPDPILLGPPEPDPIPSDELPEWMRRQIKSVSDFTQTPEDLSTLLCLATVSAAIAGKVRIRVRQRWTEHLNLYTACILGPANRKSPVVKLISSPLSQWEAEQLEEVKPLRAEALQEAKILSKRLSKAEKELVHDGGSSEQVKDLSLRLSHHFVPPIPRLLVSDITAERLAQVMSENFGRIAVMNAEGDFLRVLAGRYTNGESTLELLKKGWTGEESFRDDRINRPGTCVPNPIIVTGLAFQPTVLSTLRNRDIFDGEGVFARFLYAVPKENLGSRKTGSAVPPLDEQADRDYRAKLLALLDSKPLAEDERARTWTPHTLNLSQDALGPLYAFEQQVEEMLRPSGTLRPIAEWGGKLVGNVIRIAGLIHVAELIGQEASWQDSEVSRGATEAAISIGRSLISHAHVVLRGMLDWDEKRRLVRYVLDRAVELEQEGSLHERDLFQACKGKASISRMADLRGSLKILEDHHLIRLEKRQSTGGRPPSPLIHLNPKLLGGIPKSLKSPGGTPSGTEGSDL